MPDIRKALQVELEPDLLGPDSLVLTLGAIKGFLYGYHDPDTGRVVAVFDNRTVRHSSLPSKHVRSKRTITILSTYVGE